MKYYRTINDIVVMDVILVETSALSEVDTKGLAMISTDGIDSLEKGPALVTGFVILSVIKDFMLH